MRNKLRLIIKKLRKNEFIKNVFTLASGTSIAQAIPILASPVLTRIYSPEDYGLLALYTAILPILGHLATGKYELAIMLPKKDEDANAIAWLSIIINLVVSLIALLVIIVFNGKISKLLNNSEIRFWLYFLPLSVFLLGLSKTFLYKNNRNKSFTNISIAGVSRNFTTTGLRLILGFLGFTPGGLITGNIVGSTVEDSILLNKTYKKKNFRLEALKKDELISMAKRYIKFPKFNLLAGLLNSFSLQVPVFFFSSFYNTSIVGFYAHSHRILSMPITIIGRAIGQVFFQKAAEMVNQNKPIGNLTFELYKKLLLIGILPFSIIMGFGDYIFSFVFGNEWIMAGKYAQFLSIWILFNFISSPLSQLISVMEKQEKGLVVNFILLVFRIIPLILGFIIFKDNALLVIVLFSLISSIFWIGFCLYLQKLAGVKYTTTVFYTIKIIVTFIVPIFLIRYILF